jgi:hypothetical protein
MPSFSGSLFAYSGSASESFIAIIVPALVVVVVVIVSSSLVLVALEVSVSFSNGTIITAPIAITEISDTITTITRALAMFTSFLVF